MKKGSGLFSVLLATMLLFTMLTSCTVSPIISQPQDPQAPQAQSTATPQPRKDPIVLTVEVFDRGTTGQTPPDNNYWTQWIQKNFGDPNNITVKFITCPRADEQNRLNVWMASGQAPDISVTYDRNLIYGYYENGGLAELTEAVDTYGQNLKSFLGEEVLKKGQYFGKQFAIPAKRVHNAKFATFMRKDWLDKLNLPIPQTRDEFYNALVAFKTQNPGNVANVVPFSLTRDIIWICNTFLESFRTDKSDRIRFIVKDPFMQIAAPGMKDGFRFLNKMYNEGLLSMEFPLDVDGKMSDAEFMRGEAGAISGNFDFPLRGVPGLMEGLKQTVPDAELVVVDPFKDSDGVPTKQVYDPAGIRIIVPKTSKHVNEAIQYLDWMTNKDVLTFLQCGEEGWGYELQDGLPIKKKVEGEKVFNSPDNIDYTLIVNGIDLGDTQKNIKLNSLQFTGMEELYISAYNSAITNGYIDPDVSTPPTEAEGKYSNSLREKGYELYARCLTCKPEEFDRVWEQQYQEFLKTGGQEVIDQRAAAWDAEH